MAENIDDPHRNASICTLDGQELHFLEPVISSISLDSVAEGLAKCARYSGQTPGVFYSVAEHSVLCSYAVSEEYALQTLMHDAAEAYTGDFASPLKKLIRTHTNILDQVEDALTRAIFAKFGIEPDSDSDAICQQAHDADFYLYVQERNQLMPEADWWTNYDDTFDPGYPEIRCHEWRFAKHVFIKRFNELFYGSQYRESRG